MTTIQIRIDENMKKNAAALFASLGTDISGATKMFISQSLRTNSLAIKGLTENGFTQKEEHRILKAIKDSYKEGSLSDAFENPKDFINSLKTINETNSKSKIISKRIQKA